jgi:DNA-binding response OmpR family regulator/HPt (histidine-containing phosphotransfer) domain-containing protein
MPAQTSPIRVLVVDDDEMSRELLTVLLELEGYAVDTAESGEAALHLLAAAGSVPDLVLADMQLPGISGAELAGKLRGACGASSLLLAISGSHPPAEVVSLFDGFLLKPFRMKEVAAALRARDIASTTTVPAGAKLSKQSAAKAPGSRSKRLPAARPRASRVSSKSVSMDTQVPQAASKKRMHAVAQANAVTEESLHRATALPVLNETIFQQLAGTMSGPQLQEMYMLCLGDARTRIAGMRKLAADHDGPRFVREAHAIKGGSGMLGATELHRRASEHESHGLAGGSRGGVQDVNSLDELSAACDRLERMLGSRL